MARHHSLLECVGVERTGFHAACGASEQAGRRRDELGAARGLLLASGRAGEEGAAAAALRHSDQLERRPAGRLQAVLEAVGSP